MTELFVSTYLYGALNVYFYHVTYAFSESAIYNFLNQLTEGAESQRKLKQIQIRTRIK